MKCAAKRTWPEKATSWEHEGEAESVEAFAAEFATIEQLALDTEFVVMTKDGDGQNIRFFRVAATNPYSLASAESRTGGGELPATPRSGPAVEEGDEASDSDVAGMPNLRPVISMLMYMAKVAIIATASIALMAVLISQLKRLLG